MGFKLLKALNITAPDDGCIWDTQIVKYWAEKERTDIEIRIESAIALADKLF